MAHNETLRGSCPEFLSPCICINSFSSNSNLLNPGNLKY
jgi:hypothetical protein